MRGEAGCCVCVRGVWGGLLFPEDNISFEGAAERKAEGAEVVPAARES